MVATPQYSQFIFVGIGKGNLGRVYNIDAYVSDVSSTLLRWDSGAGASSTSETFWTAPGPVALADYSMINGTADTQKLQITRNGVPTGNILRYSIHLTTLNNRPRLNIRFMRGDKVGAIQLAD